MIHRLTELLGEKGGGLRHKAKNKRPEWFWLCFTNAAGLRCHRLSPLSSLFVSCFPSRTLASYSGVAVIHLFPAGSFVMYMQSNALRIYDVDIRHRVAALVEQR